MVFLSNWSQIEFLQFRYPFFWATLYMQETSVDRERAVGFSMQLYTGFSCHCQTDGMGWSMLGAWSGLYMAIYS